jgi:hypothetical protein
MMTLSMFIDVASVKAQSPTVGFRRTKDLSLQQRALVTSNRAPKQSKGFDSEKSKLKGV